MTKSASKKKNECAITPAQLQDNYDVARANYARIHRKMYLLDAVDRGKLWEALGAKFPKYQILPDTNWVHYIKSNLLASIYTVTKGASLIPTCDEDKEVVENLNVAIDYIWDISDVGYYQMQAGSNAALFNLGITQVGWDANATGGDGDTFFKGDVVFKDIHPAKFMRDPFAKDLQSSAYCMTWSDEHKTTLLHDKKYRERFKAFLENQEVAVQLADPVRLREDTKNGLGEKGYYKLVIHFVKYNDDEGNQKMAEIHTLGNSYILWYNNDVRPAMFPFAECFCNLPEGDVVGTSEPARILSNNISYNIMNSMMLTAEYKNQRPPRFVSSQSGLNIASFCKYGNEADHTFVVNGDASRAVHYHQFPTASAVAQSLQAGLMNDIQLTSGIDGRYTGRDTGSVITTGGVSDMLDRVTLIDTPKIMNYERYAKDLTKLILANFVEFSMKRTYFRKGVDDSAYEAVVVDYKALSNKALFHYAINISTELPKNKQRVAAAASALMEKQMQYAQNNNGPDLITAEEWLQLQDLPFKELMQKRMGIQRVADATEQFAENLFGYAALLKEGLDPDAAIAAIGKNQAAKERGEQPPVELPPMDTLLATNTPEMPVEQAMLENNPAATQQQIDPNVMAAMGSDMNNTQQGPDIASLLAMLSGNS